MQHNYRRKRRAGNKRTFGIILKVSIVVLFLSITAVTVQGVNSFNQKQKQYENLKKEPISSAKPEIAKDEENTLVKDDGKILNNIFINDIEVGGLTVSEAEEKLKETYITSLGKKTITMKSGELSSVLTYGECGLTASFKEALDEAYNYGRNVSKKEQNKIKDDLILVPKIINFTPEYTVDLSAAEEGLKSLADEIYIAPVDAKYSRNNGKFDYSKEKSGRKLDVDATFEKLSTALSQNGKYTVNDITVDAVIIDVPANVTVAMLESSTQLIGSYKTTFKGSLSDARNVNLLTATSKINDTVLAPGEVFSTNKSFGDRTAQNGYQIAPVIVSGTLVDGLGGGVCQVSSTLYVAVLNSELEIVERQNHSLKVSYMDYGFDATLSGNVIDFKFKNNTEYPVYVESYLNDNKVIVNIYGKEIHDPSRKLEFSNALISTHPPEAEKVTEDPTLPLGQKVVDLASKTGYKYAVYKSIYENGKLLDKVKINDSYYKPVRATVRIGTGKNVPEVPQTPDSSNVQASQNKPQGNEASESGGNSSAQAQPEPNEPKQPDPPAEEQPKAEQPAAPEEEMPPILDIPLF